MSCSVSELQLRTSASCRLRGSSQGSGGAVSATVGGVTHGTTNNMGGPLNRPQSHKPCCLCWCCCCSCSCAALKNAEDNGPTRRDPASSELLCDGEQPTLEEIRSWGKSFDKLMRSPAGRKVFRDFLRCEYSEENILFWLACEELKVETNAEKIEEKARFIYEDYISILSPKEVSLDSRVREIVNRNMVEPTPHTFDEAQLQIYTLMHRDSYPRFVNSPLFKAIAQIEGVSASGSKSESPT
ncbi:regulator of G-protein signaling 17 isoform X2 [Sitodiplosis mosellana]|uniref:regulator of G-protein signaling 17 isoform X2 n=1 Tax=Sitodiplosis mosellana TaxID=263140 RepID=UPI002443E41F|nr:regulator of G-protein signaling 17 isoform X2 [Sitodiplosis mosellana]